MTNSAGAQRVEEIRRQYARHLEEGGHCDGVCETAGHEWARDLLARLRAVEEQAKQDLANIANESVPLDVYEEAQAEARRLREALEHIATNEQWATDASDYARAALTPPGAGE